MINQLAVGSTTRIYHMRKDCLVEHFTDERYSCKTPPPKHPYCSHNKLSFSEYHLRFRNKLIVSSKRTIMGFRSPSLKQQFMQLVESASEAEAPAMQELLPEMAGLEALLGLAESEYLYLPVDYNLFVVVTSERKWVAAEV